MRHRMHAPVREQHRWACQVLRGYLQLSNTSGVQGLRRQLWRKTLGKGSQKRPPRLGGLQPPPDHLPTPRAGHPSGLAQMIDPSQARLEEPTAVTPRGGFCGGTKQWLRNPTVPHVRIWCSEASCHSSGCKSRQHKESSPCCSVIPSGREGDQTAGSLEVKALWGRGDLVRSVKGGRATWQAVA